jgi:acetyltransferase-like isoleucine patch superfamily enzyme
MFKSILIPLFQLFNKYLYKTKYIHGKNSRLIMGRHVVANNTIFNTASGKIIIGDDTIFGHNCMLLTGKHEFHDGRRKKLSGAGSEVPDKGRDIIIGSGCWVASGAIIIGPVKIGDNVIIGAGSIVTKDCPEGVFICGNPAKIKSKNTHK